MSTRLKTMKELATIEAKNLKKHLTKKEVNRLDKNVFDPSDIERCIYGLATGDCTSLRANNLILKCATRVYNDVDSPSRADNKLNGKPTPIKKYDSRIYKYISPIEILIFSDHGGVESGYKIIDFLKGETKTLNL